MIGTLDTTHSQFIIREEIASCDSNSGSTEMNY